MNRDFHDDCYFVNCERTVLFSVKRDLDPPFTTLMEFCNCRKILPPLSMLGECLLLIINFTECLAQKRQSHCNRVLSKYSCREFLFYLKNHTGTFFSCWFVYFVTINANIFVLPKCYAIYYYCE